MQHGDEGGASADGDAVELLGGQVVPGGQIERVEDTLGEDGDPLDALALVLEPTFPGCLIRSRAIGMFRMAGEKGGDSKIFCVPGGDPRQEHLREPEDVPAFYRLGIHHFFTVYKELEPGKGVRDTAWAGRAEGQAR